MSTVVKSKRMSRAKLIYRDIAIYQTWFEWLKLSPKYKLTCESKGRRGLVDLYKDWGDIYNVDFYSWFRQHRERLFGEPKPAAVSLLDEGERVPANSITISIPLGVPRAWALRRSQRIIKAKFSVVKGLQKSEARYPVTRLPNVPVLRRVLFVYNKRREIDSVSRKPFTFGQIAMMKNAGVGKEATPNAVTKVWQMYNRADEIIDAVEHGQFPKLPKRTSAAR